MGRAFQYPYQVRAYELAAKIPNVLNQMPCYCYCERMGHNSLHTCFEIDARRALRHLYEGSLLRLRANQAEEDSSADPGRHHQGDWKAIDLETAAKKRLSALRYPSFEGGLTSSCVAGITQPNACA